MVCGRMSYTCRAEVAAVYIVFILAAHAPFLQWRSLEGWAKRYLEDSRRRSGREGEGGRDGRRMIEIFW